MTVESNKQIFTDYWMRQPYEYRLAARFGTMILDVNQLELELRWDNVKTTEDELIKQQGNQDGFEKVV